MAITGNQSFTTDGGRMVKVKKGQTHDVTEAVWIKSGEKMRLEAADEISLICGNASIVLESDGTITIKGIDINIDGSGEINVKAKKDLTLKGKKINQN